MYNSLIIIVAHLQGKINRLRNEMFRRRERPPCATTGPFSYTEQSACKHAHPAKSLRHVAAVRDHRAVFIHRTKRVQARAPREIGAARCRRARPPGRFPTRNKARASTRIPRSRCGTLPLSVRGRRKFRDGCIQKCRLRRLICTAGIPPRCEWSSSPPASSSDRRPCGG